MVAGCHYWNGFVPRPPDSCFPAPFCLSTAKKQLSFTLLKGNPTPGAPMTSSLFWCAVMGERSVCLGMDIGSDRAQSTPGGRFLSFNFLQLILL